MRAGFQITTEKTNYTVTVTLAELVKWARQNGKPLATIDSASDDQWFEIIWWAAVREGRTKADFEDYLSSIVSVERVDAEVPKATPKGRSKGSS